jgi:hypothetical protein
LKERTPLDVPLLSRVELYSIVFYKAVTGPVPEKTPKPPRAV